MGKEDLIEVIRRVLKTDADLTFLLKLEREELENLLACIRDGIDRERTNRGPH